MTIDGNQTDGTSSRSVSAECFHWPENRPLSPTDTRLAQQHSSLGINRFMALHRLPAAYGPLFTGLIIPAGGLAPAAPEGPGQTDAGRYGWLPGLRPRHSGPCPATDTEGQLCRAHLCPVPGRLFAGPVSHWPPRRIPCWRFQASRASMTCPCFRLRSTDCSTPARAT